MNIGKHTGQADQPYKYIYQNVRRQIYSLDFGLLFLAVFTCSAIFPSSLYQTAFAEPFCNKVGSEHQRQTYNGLEQSQCG